MLAEDGGAAWRQLQSEPRPSLLVLDWMMPGIDGIEICRRLRCLPCERYSYILVVTSKAAKRDAILALDNGADDYITKPFDVNELRARLQVGRRIIQLQDELVRSREQLRLQATHDGLTGLLNRQSVFQALHDELARSQRAAQPVGVLMLDLDHFKGVNDAFGHTAGDGVLAEVAGRIANAVREYDKVGRYGGEEFMVVLPDCSEDLLGCIAERIRASVTTEPVKAAGLQFTVTVSVGGAVAAGDPIKDPADIIRVADAALYQAKDSGRNRCVIASAFAFSCQ
jgi:diguanylate cyclase (GGDEF)-like protein